MHNAIILCNTRHRLEKKCNIRLIYGQYAKIICNMEQTQENYAKYNNYMWYDWRFNATHYNFYDNTQDSSNTCPQSRPYILTILTNSTNHTDNTEDKVPLSCTSYSVWNRVRMIKILRTGSYNFSLLGAMKTVHGSHKLEITSLPHMNFTTNKLRNNPFLSPWQITYCIYLNASLPHGLALPGADLIFLFCLPYRILMG